MLGSGESCQLKGRLTTRDLEVDCVSELRLPRQDEDDSFAAPAVVGRRKDVAIIDRVAIHEVSRFCEPLLPFRPAGYDMHPVDTAWGHSPYWNT